jgi:putative oxidoreductase
MLNRATQFTFFLLRVVSGFLFFQVGASSLLGWFGAAKAAPNLMSQMGVGKILELVGGLAIMLGLFTRPVAFILSGEMAVAYWQFHAPKGTWPFQNGGQPAVLFCFLFLFFAAHGGGALSVDSLIGRSRGK